MRSLVTSAIHPTVLIVLLTGCLGQTHRIPKRDLMALAQQPPEERAQQVRVIQQFSTADEPPAAPVVHTHTTVVIGNPVPPVPVIRTRGRSHIPAAKIESDRAAFWIIVAAGAAVGLAVTEGARYDGWVELHPMHPVHLYGYGGQYMWVPLADLTPELADWAQAAVVRSSEGPWSPRGRAPLDRRGLTYSVLLGSSELPLADGTETRGFMSHIQLGGFFSRQVGLLFDIALGWGENARYQTVFDSRNALELQILPVALGKFHAGGFGQVGFGYRLDDSPEGGDYIGLLYGGGALLQLELTTRLAISARAGLTRVYGDTTADATIGLAIY